MAIIGLVIRPGVEKAAKLGQELVSWSKKHSHELAVESTTAKILGLKTQGLEAGKLAEIADPIVTLGGDGTLIGIGRYLEKKSPVLLGVNFGNLGFLTEVTPAEFFSSLESVFSGTAVYSERNMLRAEIIRDGKLVYSSQAVNDVVVQKGADEKLIDIDVEINGEQLVRVRADGLIFSTPAGSTAYSLSAGGAIIYPTVAALQITAICAHTLTFRPLVLPIDSRLTVKVPPDSGSVILTVDGQENTSLKSRDLINITKSKQVVKFVRSASRSYYEILRNKLNWGIANKA